MAKDLLVNPVPWYDESPRGYLWRLALANGWMSPQEMLATVNLTSPRILGPEDLFRRNLAPRDVLLLTAKMQRCDPRYMLSQHFRVCPRCLLEGVYLRECWDYALLPYCLQHRAPLISVHSPIVLRPILANSTGCVELATLPNTTVLLEQLLARLLGFQQRGGEALVAFGHLNANQLQRAILLFGAYFVYPDRAKPRKLAFVSDISVAQAVIKAAAVVMHNWPVGIEKLVDRHLKPDAKSRKIREQIGYLYTAVHKGFKGRCFQFFVEAFDKALAKRWPIIIDKKSFSLYQQVQANPRFTSGTVLAKCLGVSRKSLIGLIENGVIEGSVRILPSGNRQVTVLIGQEDKIRRSLKTLSLTDVAHELGLPKTCIRRLLRSGVIKGTSLVAGQPWVIAPQTVSIFRHQILEGADLALSGCQLKTLDQIARFYLPKSHGIADVIQALLDKKISYTIKGNNEGALLKSIMLQLDDLSCFLENTSHLSIPCVALEIGVKEEVAYHLVNKGFIAYENRGRLGRQVQQWQLMAFQRDYVWARDLAKRLNTSSRRVMHCLSILNISPISGPATDGGRQHLYSWKEIYSAFANYLQFD